ncbi:MAG: response regulator transcription factor [Lachnospiraceae bacterium]|nr:response regulator transcription factor [Lachnospiraceae bacterium]
MRVLIVEDEKEIADGITGILKDEGYVIDAVYDGEEGLSYILSGVYDLILLDVMLPGISGFDIVKKVRSEGIDTQVIMLTAKSQIEDKIQGLDLGADDYLTKPFDAGELLARIRARIRNTTDIKGNILSTYDIELDASTFRLKQGARAIKLSKTEYQLLECLMVNKGQILPRDTIITKVWGVDDSGDYNSLEVYISFLRKKLKFMKRIGFLFKTVGNIRC